MKLLNKFFKTNAAEVRDSSSAEAPDTQQCDTPEPLGSTSQPPAELEEQIELLGPPPPLLSGTRLCIADGVTIEIENMVQRRSGVNLYRALLRQGVTQQPINLREADGHASDGRTFDGHAANRLHQEAVALCAIAKTRRDAPNAAGRDDITNRTAHSPPVTSGDGAGDDKAKANVAHISEKYPSPVHLPHFFTFDGRSYLAEEELCVTPTLADLWQSHTPIQSSMSVLIRATEAIGHLHAAGLVHGGLRPEIISSNPDKPIIDCSETLPMGTSLETPLFPSEFTAPELTQSGELTEAGATSDPRSDVYSLGALVYCTLADAPLEQVRADLSLQQKVFSLPGVPQILSRAVGTPGSRFANAIEMHQALAQLSSRWQSPAHYSIAAASTIGLNPSRSANEDAMLHICGGQQSESGQSNWALLAVADGMGGMDAGEFASRAAIASLAQSAISLATLDNNPSVEEQARSLQHWACQAATEVTEAMQARGTQGGCTLIAALIVDKNLTLVHAGDCRAYLFSAQTQQWRVLTRDHSYVASLWQAGEIAWDDLRTHPDRSQITRALGQTGQIPEWFFDSLEVGTGHLWHELAHGEVLLLCSDGVWELVLEDEMTRLVSENFPNLSAAANSILQLVLERGAPDNATLVLLSLQNGQTISC